MVEMRHTRSVQESEGRTQVAESSVYFDHLGQQTAGEKEGIMGGKSQLQYIATLEEQPLYKHHRAGAKPCIACWSYYSPSANLNISPSAA